MTGLAGRSVVLTRPEPHNENLARLLTQAGVVVMVCPALEMAPLLSGPEIARRWADWKAEIEQGLVVIGSQTTAELLHRAGIAIDLRVAAVGPATERACRDHGWGTLSMGAHDAETLVASLSSMANLDGMDIWLPQSAAAAGALAGGLRDRGAKVESFALYEPRPRADLAERLAGHAFDAVVFSSGSAVAAFADAAGAFDAAVICIGDTTAAACAERGLTVTSVAAAPTDEAVAEAVALALGSPNGGG